MSSHLWPNRSRRLGNVISRAIGPILALSLQSACTRVVDLPSGSTTTEQSPESSQSPKASNQDNSPEASDSPDDDKSESPEAQSPDNETPEPEESESTSTEQPEPTCVGDSLLCAAPTPAGWFGPVQLQKMKDGSDAVECEAALPKDFFIQGRKGTYITDSADDDSEPNEFRNLFVDEISGTKARCSGCKAKFTEGACFGPEWSLRKLDKSTASGCSDEEAHEWGETINEDWCRAPNLHSESGRGWSIDPARLQYEGRCDGDPDSVKQEIDPLEFGNFYRSCKIKSKKKTCASKRDSCLSAQEGSPWMEQVCVARRGEHECKSSAYPFKIGMYGRYLDLRSCTRCTAKKQPGEERCDALVYVQYNDSNECEERQLADLSKVCIPHYDYKRLEPITAVAGPLKYSFSGGCTPSRVEPRGEVEALGPITFCCQHPE